MEIWLKNSDYNIRFPVLPSDYSITSASNNTTVSVYGLSQVNLLGNRKLEEVKFDVLLPVEYNAGYCDIQPEYTPIEYREIFESMKRDGVCKLTITEADWSKKVTIEEMESSEDDGTGDVTISFTFKEYVKPVITKRSNSSKKTTAKKTTVKSARTTKKSTSAKTYTVKKGDCLSKIAKTQTGDSTNWRTIYSDNKSVIGSNPNNLKVGQKLKIRASY